ncbi:MAG: DUF763 domain-containing protein [Candidatus Marinimicrobia bacterium]|jgi:hypothetical protein|nr:DUF763 domain-containing protein [Candidatus Neomarinimicrobiota bacterium]
MINSGTMGMPLHFGRMPKWLSERMGKMGSAIIESVAQNYGKSEVLTRLSDPNWFQAFGAVMGMQWNSSGVTATVLGSLKRKINLMASELGNYFLGGKGRYGWNTPQQVRRVSDKHSLNGDELVRASQLTSANSKSYVFPFIALKYLIQEGISCNACLMVSFSNIETIDQAETQLAAIRPGLLKSLEKEHITLFPKVATRLKNANFFANTIRHRGKIIQFNKEKNYV